MINLTSPGWTKLYGDKSFLIGTDKDVRLGRASWRLSSLTNMIGAGVSDGQVTAYILGGGEYWQSNDMEAPLVSGSTNAKTVVRRIQKKVEGYDNFIALTQRNNFWAFKFQRDNADPTGVPIIDYHGKWLTIEIHQDSLTPLYYFSEEKI